MNNIQQGHRMGIGALIIACSLWGTAFLFGKIALSELTVSQVVLYRFTVASLVLLPIVLAQGVRLQIRDLPPFVLAGFLTVPVTFMLQFTGLAWTSAARASLIVGCFPPLLALAAMLFFHERLSKRGWIAVGASTAGVLLIVGLPGAGSSWLGDGLVFLSLVTTIGWVLLSKRQMQKYSALAATTLTLTCGTLTLLPFSLYWDGIPSLNVSMSTWAAVIGLGLLCTALAFALWNWALEQMPAASAGVFVNLEPVIGAMLGVVVFHDAIEPITLLGGMLVLAAAWAISRPEKSPVQAKRDGDFSVQQVQYGLGSRLLNWGQRLRGVHTPMVEPAAPTEPTACVNALTPSS